METKTITTQLGTINYRDTIFVNSVETKVYPLTLTIIGEIDGNHCSPKIDNRKIPFRFSFHAIAMFNCFELDYSLVDIYIKSSFDEVIDSELLREMSLSDSHKHFILSTYDYVFEVVAKDYELKLV